jgi:hypothetical protein
MADNHGPCGQALGNGVDIVDIVSDRTFAQWLRCGAASVTAKAYRQRAITLVREEV